TDSVYVIYPPEPANGYPGDSVVQTAFIRMKDFNVKWVIGIAKPLGPFTIFLDYNVSKFNIFTFGLDFKF
ncbi:MAG: hypothetical protein ABSG15_15225, partial [FCB group bacterium]